MKPQFAIYCLINLLCCRLEVSTAECKRLQAKASFTEGELSLARDELAGERSQATIDIQTKAQHAELLRKVEQINVLSDSNRMLRQEKDSLQPKIDQLEKQVHSIYIFVAVCRRHSEPLVSR